MRYTLHSIRKTFATSLVNNNVSIFDAMKLLRHKNVSTTMKYYTYLNRLGNEANKVFGQSEAVKSKEEDYINNKQLKILIMES